MGPTAPAQLLAKIELGWHSDAPFIRTATINPPPHVSLSSVDVRRWSECRDVRQTSDGAMPAFLFFQPGVSILGSCSDLASGEGTYQCAIGCTIATISRRIVPRPLGTGLAWCRMTGKGLLTATLLLAACGNYSNEDLEFMNAVPAREDLSADMPRSALAPANEAELSRLTHDTVIGFNSALGFLDVADEIRTYQPTSRIRDGRIWGPVPMGDHPGWQWRFRVVRDPELADQFNYWFEVEPVGAGDSDWLSFIDGRFAASTGVRRGVGIFRIQTDPIRTAGFSVDVNAKGESLRSLSVDYSTAAFPISVTMNLMMYTDVPINGFTSTTTIRYHAEREESGAGLMEFSGSDSMGRSYSVDSRWMPTGRGRADATATDGTVTGTWTQCWDNSFKETYEDKPWAEYPEEPVTGDPNSCPVFSEI